MKIKTKEQLYQENLERIAKYRPLDDDFMRELFRDNIPLTEMVLRIITGKKDLSVIRQETQYDMKQVLNARSLCLDVFATDSENKRYNLEIQRADKGATVKRARYHSSAIDVESLNAKGDFENLPITYVIFITENDVRGENRAIYHFEWRDTETGKPLDDGTHIIYVNGAYNNKEDNSDIAKLMHDFRCSKSSDMNFELFASKVKFFKETEEGVKHMCKLNEDMINEATNEAKYKNSVSIALNLISMGLNLEDIAKATGLSIEEVQELSQNLKKAE